MPSENPQILIVDDDPVTCELLCEVFEREGFSTSFEQSADAALLMLGKNAPDVILSDIRMKTQFDGLNLLDHVRREHPLTPIVLMTAFGSIDTAIRAVREGAFDYISKPFDIDKMVMTIRRALDARAHGQSNGSTKLNDYEFTSGLVGRSHAMLEIYKTIARISDSRAAVLITGESGTGKELIARAIHTHSKRANAPFVAINCGALTETLLESELFGHMKGSFTGAIANKRGIFEEAGEGTVFLDEISETSPALQVKLLRVLQEREVMPVGSSSTIKVAARIIAASNSNLENLSESGAFRRDLLYRLNVIHIHVPPLRDRRDDIPLLVAHLVRKHTPEGQAAPVVDDRVLRVLKSYSWPGNVRELENVIERAIAFQQGGRITLENLPSKVCDYETERKRAVPQPDDLNSYFTGLPTIDEVERRYLQHVLEVTGGNRTLAAKILGINRRTLYRMAERYQLDI
ncbi:MAG TPA: sigma-54 dependent transcriptional regulator [Pyrinomonadaceae bacterium]|nr:sigma-54 dependent transcriptional regulator [Pyrinomonadaceae bacterium]